MMQEMESLTLLSKPGPPSAKPSTSSSHASSVSLSGPCWYSIHNPGSSNQTSGHLVKFLLDFVDWEQKRKRCEQLHVPPTKCEILPIWAAGSRHLIRKAQFEDGTSWVLKTPFPEYISEEKDELTLECATKSNHGIMRLEYETSLAFQ